ncbi:dehydrogenase [Streptomyces davaonensis JCM 4913]|uniref:Dehydrogenase n=1 Tax=Streptomyces davaonensis (strain DSM 101723 / JCM 4913 / KCC S-0913 / 768) TaxID=1214101 RepID=K4QYH4_STRDJ|nr:zinc-binding dehydrogenase [Streptomyces davaonensis]CCK26123.1 dehydrogenase [Streptomyces davaonensis JCM 4913]
MDTMLAGRFHLNSKKFAVEEVPVPAPGPGEVLIEVKAAGVCLSDVHLIDGSLVPLFATSDTVTVGHEVSGVIHTLGPDLKRGLTVGTRVTLEAGKTCGRCADCVRRRPCTQMLTAGIDYDGGWAQYTVAREDTLIPIPDSLPFDQAAIIPDAVSTPYAAVVATAGVRPAQSVGVWGVGGVGAHNVRLARLVGAAPIIAVDPLPSARERALAFGADMALDPAAPDFADQVRAATGGRGLDFAFDCAGVPVVREQAASVLGLGGSLILVGITPHPLTISEGLTFNYLSKQVRGHYGGFPESVTELVRLTAAGRLDLAPSITDHIPLAAAAAAVNRLENKIGDPIRLILVP